jgi:hypothetical protein
MEILDALRTVTEKIKEWSNKTKADKDVVDSMSSDMTKLFNQLNQMPNDLVVREGKLYLAKDGTPIEDTAVTLPVGYDADDVVIFDCGTSYNV